MNRYLILLSIATASLYGDVTFFIASDTHVGRNQVFNDERENRITIEDMNNLPGTKYPGQTDEKVEKPLGVLIAGDLTGDLQTHWNGYWWGSWKDGFDQLYQVNGEGALHYPVYEGYGNHDFQFLSERVLTGIYLRNMYRSTPVHLSDNGLHYSWDWEKIHFVNLNLYPGGEGRAERSLDFLKYDLETNLTDPKQPVILYHHYPYNIVDEWWTDEEREKAYEVMKGYNIIAIFVGHEHKSARAKWNGFDIFYVPHAYEHSQYSVCKIKGSALTVTERKDGQWGRTWKKTFLQGDQ